MTQLQQIENQFQTITPTAMQGKHWKKAVNEGNIVQVVFEIKEQLKEGPESVINSVGESIAVLIKNFNPITEGYVLLGEAGFIAKQPRDSRNLVALAKLIKDLEILFKMAGLYK